MPLELSILRGPLRDEDLDAIAATYGRRDPRYARRDFLRVLYDENPFGYSHHAFLRAGGEAVGHYSIIPIRARVGAATVPTGKGEALFVAESHRRTSVRTPRGDALPGMAMMNALHERALADGLSFLHSITHTGVGLMLKLRGFRPVTLSLDQRQFLIHPPPPGPYLFSRGRLGASFAAGQRALLRASRAALGWSGAPRVEINPPEAADFHLGELSASGEDSSGRWTLSRDRETLEWMRRLGRLDFASVTGRPEHFAVSTRGHTREILMWRVPPSDHRAGLAVLRALLHEAIRDDARTVTVSRALAERAGSSLELAVYSLGFLSRTAPVTLYLKPAPGSSLPSSPPDFTRLFNI